MIRRYAVHLLLLGCLLTLSALVTFQFMEFGEQAFIPQMEPTAAFVPTSASQSSPSIASAATIRGSYHYADGRILLDLQPEAGETVEVMVSELNGQAVYVKQWPGSSTKFREEINLAYLPDGMYMLQIQSGNQQLNRMLVK
ncbi:MAG: T9SS type A sorting domain-containing protein [Bacteroidota bacterium]